MRATSDNELLTPRQYNSKLRRLRDSNHFMHPHAEFEIRITLFRSQGASAIVARSVQKLLRYNL